MTGFDINELSFDYSRSNMTERWNDSIKQLLNLKYLSRQDIDDTAPPKPGTVESLIEYLNKLRGFNTSMPAPTRIASTTQGEIIIEWQLDNGNIELEVDEPGEGEWMFVIGDTEPKLFPVHFFGIPSIKTSLSKTYFTANVESSSNPSWYTISDYGEDESSRPEAA